MVNRDPEYLKETAIEYARTHNPKQIASVLAKYSHLIHERPTTIRSYPYEENKIIRKPQHNKKRRSRSKQTSFLDRKSIFQALQAEQKFQWPLERKSFYVSSLFGSRKKRNGEQGFHTGIDLAALRGTPVYAAQEGKVIQAFKDTGYGNTVLIRHSPSYKTRYAHLHNIIVSKGQFIKAGQQIGTVGATGNVHAKKGNDPSHLHFEIYVDGKQVNPLYFLS